MLNTKRQAPVSMATLPRLLDALADEHGNARTVADVVACDPGLSTKVLAMANSAQFGVAHTVTRLELAIGLVGTATLQTLAIASANNLFDPHESLRSARDHALRVACAARLLAPWAGCGTAEAFAAGLLHDLGELLLWQARPTEYAAVYDTWPTHDDQLASERTLYGIDHAAAGAEHLARWNVPQLLVDAVGGHAGPWSMASRLALVVAAAEAAFDEGGDRSACEALGLAGEALDDLAAEAHAEFEATATLLLT